MKLASHSCALLLAASVVGQSNAVPGTDINIYDLGGPNVYGRVGAAYPNGTAGVVIGHSHANCGSVNVPWFGSAGGVMVETYAKIAFLLARESDGRMVQISGKSFMKHSRTAFNFSGGGPCGPCQSGPFQTFRVGCYDIYTAGFNGSRFHLGPTTEINPWLGAWDPLGSYIDIEVASSAVVLGNGCDLWVDNSQLLTSELLPASAAGFANYPVDVPAGLMPTDVAVQAFEFVTSGPLFGFAAASNGLLIRAAATGCP